MGGAASSLPGGSPGPRAPPPQTTAEAPRLNPPGWALPWAEVGSRVIFSPGEACSLAAGKEPHLSTRCKKVGFLGPGPLRPPSSPALSPSPDVCPSTPALGLFPEPHLSTSALWSLSLHLFLSVPASSSFLSVALSVPTLSLLPFLQD